jgi:HEAT repeat protein
VLEPLEVAAALHDPAPEVRRRACELAGKLQFVDLAHQLTEALGDSSAVVVEAACYALGELEGLSAEGLDGPEGRPSERSGPEGRHDRRAADGEPVRDAPSGPEGGGGDKVVIAATAVRALMATAMSHPEPLCREAAVAALGSLRVPAGLPAVLAALEDKPAVRRRAVVALAGFEGPEVDAALAKAAGDVDWQVRQLAEDLGGSRA